MKTYIGTELINAKPMTRGEYNDYRNWTPPVGEDQASTGYLVEYLDGGMPHDSRHAGYISWSPAEQFDNAYRETSGLSFGLAIEALKKGHKVARNGWNGKGMWLVLVPGTELAKLNPGTPYAKALHDGTAGPQVNACEILPHIDMWTPSTPKAVAQCFPVGLRARPTCWLTTGQSSTDLRGRSHGGIPSGLIPRTSSDPGHRSFPRTGSLQG